MDDNDNLDLLASLLEENDAAAEHVSEENDINNMAATSEPDDYDKLFDEEDEESYTEEVEGDKGESSCSKEDVAELFGDVGDLSEEEQEKDAARGTPLSLAADQAKETTNQALQDELKKLQEQMKKLQERLEMTAIAQAVSTGPSKKTSDKSPAVLIKERKPPKLQESPCFSTQLNNSSFPRTKIQCHNPASLSGNRSHVSKPAPNFSPQPLKSVTGNRPSMGVSQKSQVPKSSSVNNHEVSLEVYSGLRLRKPRVSSVEMERKMSGRKFIRLSQLQDKLASVNLGETDWVTFGVIIKKVTPQSSNNGKTFSIWRLNDLRDFSRCVSLFLFGDVHKDHWKTDQGMVIGLLNANLMKPKEGSDEVCVTVDNPQKILLLGEAMDLGTCKSRKKNGELCTQLVNLNECEYCQYHIQSQYRRLSSKRSDLQSTFSSNRAPKRAVKKNLGLKERLCQEGFYYGGVSSAAYAASVASAATPKRKIQTTLSNLVVKGVDAVLLETKQKLGLAKEPLSCSEEFKELLSMPSFGARNLNKHLASANIPGSSGKDHPTFQSISASALLKQQKQQMLEARKRKSEELQRRFLQNTSSESTPVIPSLRSSILRSPAPGAEFPKAAKLASPQTPRLGTGISEGDDILFFDDFPPPAPKLNALAEAKKMAAINKLREKGRILSKVDPNSIKRKRSDLDSLDISERVEKNTLVSEGSDASAEPEEKKQRQQLAYLESDEFQEILNARSKHMGVLKEFEAELQERYFEPLVKKEQMEEKMRNIREVKCRVATCKTCKYTYFKLLDSCVEQNHDYLWHDGVKRFFKCPCGNRAISLDKLPKKHCSNCGLFKWERDGMLKEKKGPKIGAETLLPRGEEQAKFLNSMK